MLFLTSSKLSSRALEVSTSRNSFRYIGHFVKGFSPLAYNLFKRHSFRTNSCVMGRLSYNKGRGAGGTFARIRAGAGLRIIAAERLTKKLGNCLIALVKMEHGKLT